MSSKNTTEVIIGGKVFTLGGYESEEYLQKIASYINNKAKVGLYFLKTKEKPPFCEGRLILS